MTQPAQTPLPILRVNSLMTQPTISVVVPVYNTRDYLLDTLQSLSPKAGQQLEIIIVNDGSTDDSDSIIRNWLQTTEIDTTYLVQHNQGLSLARMNGASQARGKYLVFCDSDDLLDTDTIFKLASMMTDRSVDVGLFRSCVFEHSSGISYDFYDFTIWESLLDGKSHLLTTPQRTPSLFRLEPNANTRLFRREFFESEGITFPSGLHFEDLPAHVETLAAARSILCIDKTGYYYRVNRPGKITDQKSEKRFDILESARLAIKVLDLNQLPTPIRAWTILLACRMTYWCGKNTLNKDRLRFFGDACRLFSEQVPEPVVRHAIKKCGSTHEILLLISLTASADVFLARHASGLRPRLRDALQVFTKSHHRLDILRIAASVLLRKLMSMASRPQRPY